MKSKLLTKARVLTDKEFKEEYPEIYNKYIYSSAITIMQLSSLSNIFGEYIKELDKFIPNTKENHEK